MRKTKKIGKKQKIFLLVIIIVLIVFMVILITRTQKEGYAIEKASSDVMDTIEEKEEPENEVHNDNIIVPIEEDTSWDEEAEDTKVETDKKDEENIQQNNKLPYYIKINYTENCVTIYKKDGSGKYTVPVKAMVCSTGTATPTSGVYKMTDKYKWHALNGGVYGQYCSRITGHILFHSVPYTKKSPDSLEYWEYDKLGTKASAGCIRLAVEDAMWIYNNCASGTYVEFYSSSTSGPLGKPSAKKISSNTTCRNWDPTDPDTKNPWHTYTEPKEETPEQDNNTNESTNQNNTHVQENQNKVESNNTTEEIDDNNTSEDNNTTIEDTNTSKDTNEIEGNNTSNSINSDKKEEKEKNDEKNNEI